MRHALGLKRLEAWRTADSSFIPAPVCRNALVRAQGGGRSCAPFFRHIGVNRSMGVL